ncbi:MAG: septum formation initiator family protein [Eubacteriales bacterium]|nr:septum formation initiator family protein [Eubacteriales bacterium]
MKKGLPLIYFVVFVFCVFVGVKLYSLKSQQKALEEKKILLEQQIKSEEQRAEELEALEKYMQTKKYMEDVAKDKLGLVYPDEILLEPTN